MEESLQNMEIKFKGREQMCRNLQEKIKELEAQLAKERKARSLSETKLREHQRQSEKFPKKKPSLLCQSNSLKNVRERTPLSKDLTNLPKQGLTLERNTKKQEGRSYMKVDMIESFASGTPLNRENVGKSTLSERKKGRFSICALPPRSSVLPAARRISMIPSPPLRNAIFKTEAAVDHSSRNDRATRRTSMSTLSCRTSSIQIPRRTSMAVLPMRRNEGSTYELHLPAHQFTLSPMEEKCGKNNIPYHDSGPPHTSTPVSLRGVKISHALDRFCGTIHSKVCLNSPLLKASNVLQEINQKQENHMTDIDDNFTVASSSLDMKPQQNENSRLRRLSTMRTWGSYSAAGARAQRVLCGNRTSSGSITEDRENEMSRQLDSADILSNR